MPDAIRGVGTPDPIAPASTNATSTAQSAEEAANIGSAASSVAPGVDLADVGQTEALLQTIIQAASNTPGIDQAKVAELQQAIASGTYQANPQAIAQKIVELDVQLGTAGNLQ